MNKIKKIIKSILRLDQKNEPYDFDKNNPLGDGGERVDFTYSDNLDISKLDLYQQNHVQRYLFAEKIIQQGCDCGDFACGTGYGSAILSKKANSVLGIDLNEKVISEIKKRYQNIQNVSFENKNLLEIDFKNKFDTIVSFETIEHFTEENILKLISLYHKALKNKGQLIFSVPYMQEESENAKKLGFHLTFEINENKISNWLSEIGFTVEKNYYQNYKTHTIHENLDDKEFIICIAKKNA
ncbi:class I SAM-dependent methyltransferase [Chryseobacterium balustinum]|uniref:Methyltransferase domain-containing protein n=1 Tax=Chryseobacterium balustinum TaxID=246 RepID=A0AAX2IH97_9FLAO|nr:class I SAM-dependent methyltransferase [Chryseobacterium balustinum]AZB31068.1 class I SAM-dependent methyltransferase [Chryseobacterium balustinum]SKB40710.1 Methyltransferase domain-containing protein [Chryseobacterium balustinum]SQA87782.1 Probable S-adenosylmethionine-dependent methyltransferase MSMEG_2350 [Chryseobacterium balustinum]